MATKQQYKVIKQHKAVKQLKSNLQAFKLLIDIDFDQKLVFDVFKNIFKFYDDELKFDPSLCNVRGVDPYVITTIYEGPIWSLLPSEIKGLEVIEYEKKPYIINPRTKILYDENCEKVCRWGDSKHATYNIEFPNELVPTCAWCNNYCDDIFWTYNPYLKEVHLKVKHDWYCKSCYDNLNIDK